MAGIAIAIPTYNRPAILDTNLRAMLPDIIAAGATVYVSDDSDNDDTATRIAALQAEYPFIRYRRNSPALRHDANLLATLQWPVEEHVWLLGDARRIVPGVLAKVTAFAGAGQDMIFVNVHAPSSGDNVALTGDALTAFMRAQVWHQTLTGATIYARSVVAWLAERDRPTYRNFPQLSVILGFLEERGGAVGWIDDVALQSDSKDSYWEASALEVFVDDWVRVIGAHPRLFPKTVLAAVLKEHSRRQNLFNADRLLRLKAAGRFGPRWFAHPHFFDVMHLSPARVVALALLPTWLRRGMSRALAGIRGRR